MALLICLAPLTVFGAEPPENLPNAIGEVVYMVGTVKAEQPDGTVRELDLKKQVIPKDVIVTSTKSSVEIVFKDDSVFSQGSSARISLDEFIYSGKQTASKLLFKMGEGTFRYVTGQIVKQNPDGFALETPTTTIGIRGTEVYATVTPSLERVGNLDLSAGHTMSVGPQEISRPMHAVSVDPTTGSVSAPEPVSPEEARAVIKAAPQTTQGEPGAKNEDVDDMTRKVDAFSANINRTKDELGTGKPDYQDLHTLSLQQSGQKSAERDNDKAEEAQSAAEGGGGGGY
ncbi:FecR family protein [Pseudodesulfovibrio portus]|uniref:FecR family protein n=1 Tax=Pseudodesulfovibrio portus TaxID=231439 RepID=UPI002231CA96|nr:FecR domain-containing protein [Pseudodesulfovibrio portus]